QPGAQFAKGGWIERVGQSGKTVRHFAEGVAEGADGIEVYGLVAQSARDGSRLLLQALGERLDLQMAQRRYLRMQELNLVAGAVGHPLSPIETMLHFGLARNLAPELNECYGDQ